jgi:hypothetical protein
MRPSQLLERQFLVALKQTNKEAAKLGYFSTEFDAMLDVYSGVGTALRLVQTSHIQTGMRRLCALGRPDLTTEAVMLRPEYKELFTPDQLAAASWRLSQMEVARSQR